MNYDFLSLDKLGAPWLRYVAIPTAFITIIIGIYLKIADTSTLFGISQDHLKPILLFSLLFIINTRNTTEDERITLIRLQIYRFGYNILVGILAVILLVETTGGDADAKVLLFEWVISIVTTQVLVYETVKHTKIMDFFENHQGVFQLLALIVIVFLLQVSQWFW